MKITHIVIHYSATFEDQDPDVKDIDRMHKARGWSKVGYHYVIKRDGTIQVGRKETEIGAHVGGQNTGKLGICAIGGLNRATGANVGVDNRTPEQIEAMIGLVRELLKRHPGAKVVGHRDLAPTQCPGFDVAVWWAKVQHKKAPEPKPVVGPAKTTLTTEYTVQKGDTWYGISEDYGVTLANLWAWNGAKQGDVLTVGRKLRLIPPEPVEPEHWFVRLVKALFGWR